MDCRRAHASTANNAGDSGGSWGPGASNDPSATTINSAGLLVGVSAGVIAVSISCGAFDVDDLDVNVVVGG